MPEIMPGDLVIAFDSRLFKDDVSTPLSYTKGIAKVIRRYGYRSTYNPDWIYPDLVDLLFDHNPNISHGHFTETVTLKD